MLFQFTPLREGRQIAEPTPPTPAAFQFTPLREGRLALLSDGFCKSLYFNSRPSARGDARCAQLYCEIFISIHAPPRGATNRSTDAAYTSCISIHAPPRGATQCASNYIVKFLFQFTPLREGRRQTPLGALKPSDFNSRPSARGDLCIYRHPSIVQISIHAPPRGATRRIVGFSSVLAFQFTPLREGRLRSSGTLPRQSAISIHAPPRGATQCHELKTLEYLFQFTPLREGRQ